MRNPSVLRLLLLLAVLAAVGGGALLLRPPSRPGRSVPVSPAPPLPDPEVPAPPPEPETPVVPEEGAVLLGEVIRASDGARVEGAQVRITVHGPGDRTWSELVAAADGTFRLAGLPVGGMLAAEVAAEGYWFRGESRDPFPDADLRDRRGLPILWLRPGENRVSLGLLPGVPVHVRVVDGTGEAVPGALVIADDCIGWLDYSAEARTGPDGTCVFGAPEGDNLHVRLSGATGEVDYEMIEPVTGDRVEVTLSDRWRGTGIAGRVADPEGVPIPDVLVSAVNSKGNTEGWAATDEAGNYRMDGVKPGHYSLVAHRIGWRAGVYEVVLHPGSTVKKDLTIDRALAISGRLLRADGEPAVGFRIRVDVVLPKLEYIRRGPGDDAPVGPDGAFTATGLPPGDYELVAWIRLEDGDIIEETLAGQVTAGTEGLSFRLPDPYWAAGGRVLLRGAPPERPYSVSALDEEGYLVWGPAVFTNADGSYRMSGLRAGQIRLLAHVEGFAPSRPMPVDVGPGLPEPKAELRIETEEARVLVRVRDKHDRPVPEWSLVLMVEGEGGGSVSRSADLDREGRVGFAQLPAGAARLEFGFGGFGFDEEEDESIPIKAFPLKAGGTVELDVRVEKWRVVSSDLELPGEDLLEGDLIRVDVEPLLAAREEGGPTILEVERGGRRLTITIPPDDEEEYYWIDSEDHLRVTGVEIR